MHTQNKPVLYQKQTKTGFRNNININKDNFTNLLATFSVKVQLKMSTNERNFSIFCRYFACDYVGFSHPATGRIFKNTTWLFIGSRNSSLTTEIYNYLFFVYTYKWHRYNWKYQRLNESSYPLQEIFNFTKFK